MERPPSNPEAGPETDPFAEAMPHLVVGVVASAGGLHAFRKLLERLNQASSMTLILVQHLDPNHESLLPQLLESRTDLTVKEADQGERLEPATIYVIPPGGSMAIRNGQIELSHPRSDQKRRLAVDHLFRSLALEFGSRAAGVLLSGAWADGSSGLRDIHRAGGLVLAQDPEESDQSSMPESAVSTQMVDWVLRADQMAEALERFARLPSIPAKQALPPKSGQGGSEPAKSIPTTEFPRPVLERLADVLADQMDFDARVFKQGTLERRILRRMLLGGWRQPDDYLQHFQHNPDEHRALIQDLMIGVTDFFRDPEAFKLLRKLVINPLVDSVDSEPGLRIWVPGCATGEEAYSLGMEFMEAMNAAHRSVRLQIFATDIDEKALEVARAGIYPEAAVQSVSPERLQRFFHPLEGRGYKVRPQLRDAISFAVHDVTKQPPFSRILLISCRNLLIYLRGDAQDAMLDSFNFSLSPGGCLFLGISENVETRREYFTTVSKKARIFQKNDKILSRFTARLRTQTRNRFEIARETGRAQQKESTRESVRAAVFEAILPPTLVVSADGTLRFMQGDLRPYLRFPQGEDLRFDIHRLVNPELRTRTRTALFRCRERQEEVAAQAVVEGDLVRIRAAPVPKLEGDCVALCFETVARPVDSERPSNARGVSEEIVGQLERELEAAHEDLRSTHEELEMANEELRSSNEEAMTMNEELQSSNEELEATSEELRLLNEELTTVNVQLREKVDQLEEANDDLFNFLSSTKLATLFLDASFRIKRFTPAAEELLQLDRGDLGRSIEHFRREPFQDDFAEEARKVFQRLEPIHREIYLSDARWFLRTINPYTTEEDRRVGGVVVVFTDITERKRQERAVRASEERLALALRAADLGIFELNVQKDSLEWSDQMKSIFGLQPEEDPPRDVVEGGFIHPEDSDRVRNLMDQSLSVRGSHSFEDEHRIIRKDGTQRWVSLHSKTYFQDRQATRAVGTVRDVTERKLAELKLKESEQRLRLIFDQAPALVAWHEGRDHVFRYANQLFLEHMGHRSLLGRPARTALPELNRLGLFEFYDQVFRTGQTQTRQFEVDGLNEPVQRHIYSQILQPLFESDGWVSGVLSFILDITQESELTRRLEESEERFRTLANHMAQLSWMADRRGQAFWFNQRWFDYTGTTMDDSHGWDWTKCIHPEHRDRAVKRLTECIEDEEPWEDTFALLGQDRQYRWFLGKAVPIWDPDGRVSQWFGTCTDVTTQLETAEMLREADQQKDQYLAMLGHELRNPLAAIRGASDLLKADPEPETVKTAQRVLERQSLHMNRLMDGLLDVSRIARGKLDLQVACVDLNDLIKSWAADWAKRFEQKHIQFTCSPASESVWVQADPDRMMQVVENLLMNALKFTGRDDQVHLRVVPLRTQVEVCVEDTGAGIDPNRLRSIFKAFQQGEQDAARSQGGLGLGLSLAEGILRLHGGTIWAESEGVGQGSRFKFRLPRLSGPGPARPTSVEATLQPRRILVVEDNRDAASMLQAVLRREGHEVQVAHSGIQALEMAKANPPEVVLCDLGLPDLSGLHVAHTLRQTASTQNIRLIALTGYGQESDRSRSQKAGFDAHLVKPVTLERLRSVLRSGA